MISEAEDPGNECEGLQNVLLQDINGGLTAKKETLFPAGLQKLMGENVEPRRIKRGRKHTRCLRPLFEKKGQVVGYSGVKKSRWQRYSQ